MRRPNDEETDTTVHHGQAGHQKSVEQIELPLARRGEAPTGQRRSESKSTAPRSERSGGGDADGLMERIVESDNLGRALKRVRQNEGSAGIDGMTVDQLGPYLRGQWAWRPAARCR